MEPFKLFDKAINGFLKIAVPKDFEGKMLGINIKVFEEDTIENEAVFTADQRGKALMKRFGSAKFKDYVTREDDVYYQ